MKPMDYVWCIAGGLLAGCLICRWLFPNLNDWCRAYRAIKRQERATFAPPPAGRPRNG